MTAYPSWTPAARAGIVPLHPLTFGTILGRSFTALRRNPRVLLGFAIGMQMVAYIVLLLAVGGTAYATFSRLATVLPGSDEYEALFAGSTVITAVAGIVLGIAATALTVLVQGVVVADVAHGVVSEKLGLGALVRRVRPAFWRLLGYTFLATGIVFAVAAVLVLAVIALSTAALAAGIILGILLFLAAVPLTFWLTTKLFLVPEVIVLEGSGVFAAIGRSWRLTRGRFWKTLGVWFLIQLAFSIVAQIVSIPFSLLSSVFGAVVAPTGDPDATSVITLFVSTGLVQIVTLLIQSVALIVGASAGTLLYVDARMRTEGLDHDLQSYVDQRQGGAGEADPYRWHVGRQVAPAPVGYGPVASGGYAPPPGYVTPTGYPPYAAPGSADAPAPPVDPAPPIVPPTGDPSGETPRGDAPTPPSSTDWAAPGSSDPTR